MNKLRMSVSPAEHRKMMDVAMGHVDHSQAEARTDPFFANSGEVFYPSEDATRYNYNSATEKWQMSSVRIRIAEKHFSEGGMRFAYRAGVINPEGTVTSCVVKVFKHVDAVTPDMVFHEALTQSVAQSYAVAFNALVEEKKLRKHVKVKFLPVTVLHLPQRGPNYYAAAEPYLKYSGKYKKHNDNQGGAAPGTAEGELAQTFSYFSFVASKGALVVCDIQGVGNTFTDPQIHSADGKRLFGAGNMGQKGINSFLSTFGYNEMCAALGLPKPEPHADYVEMRQIMNELGSFTNFQSNVVKQATAQKQLRAMRYSEEQRRLLGVQRTPPSPPPPQASVAKVPSRVKALRGGGSRRSLSKLVRKLTGTGKRLSAPASSTGTGTGTGLLEAVTLGPPLPPRKQEVEGRGNGSDSSKSTAAAADHLAADPLRSIEATLDEMLGLDEAEVVLNSTNEYNLFHLV